VGLERHSSPIQPSPGPFSDGSTSTETPQKLFSRIPDARPQYQVAEALIEQYNLALTQKDAQHLEELLVQSRRQYDLENSKRLLCQELGPVDGNRKSDPGAGTLGFVYVPMKEIEDRDRQHHTGNTARTANATQIHNTAMEMNFRWARLAGVDGGMQSETLIDRQIGNLFTGLFAFDGFQETAYVILSRVFMGTDFDHISKQHHDSFPGSPATFQHGTTSRLRRACWR
jgi:hypothetical protein